MLQVTQTAMEEQSGVPQGKYTEGLGQACIRFFCMQALILVKYGWTCLELFSRLAQVEMAFCTDREDAASMGLTAFKQLLETYTVSLAQIGRSALQPKNWVKGIKQHSCHLMEQDFAVLLQLQLACRLSHSVV